jgi:L-methionine (R)-S-oxide reductase
MDDKKTRFAKLLRTTREILDSKKNRNEKLKAICKLLKQKVPYYNWVGFYLVNKKKQDELLLGPFEGEPTEHVRITFGKGICGQAAQSRKKFLVQDVSKETNYLSCSVNVKSEIVIPIFKDRKVVGELDIDSHALSPFTDDDTVFLKKIGRMVCGLL